MNRRARDSRFAVSTAVTSPPAIAPIAPRHASEQRPRSSLADRVNKPLHSYSLLLVVSCPGIKGDQTLNLRNCERIRPLLCSR